MQRASGVTSLRLPPEPRRCDGRPQAEEEAGEDEDEAEKLEELEFDEADLGKDQYDEEDWSELLNDAGYSAREEFDPNDVDKDARPPASKSDSEDSKSSD